MAIETLGASLAEYAPKYRHAKLDRDDDGILTVTLHTDGDSLVWSARAHDELAYLFTDIACDQENRVVVLTGAGDSFCNEIDFESFSLGTPQEWYHTAFEGKRLIKNFMAIEVPIIAAVNGPVTFHPELPAICDLVLVSETAVFQDAPHFASGIIPGDGAQYVWPYVLGPARGRYFLLTGQKLDAGQALEYGVVNEVLPQADVLARALEHARTIAAKTDLTIRSTRLLMKTELDRIVNDQQGAGFPHQALAVIDMSWGQ